MTVTNKPPAITATAFECPHCGAFTTQSWHKLYAARIGSAERVPQIPDEAFAAEFSSDQGIPEHIRHGLVEWCERMRSGMLFLDGDASRESVQTVGNLFLSQCFNCDRMGLWVHESLVYPAVRVGPQPNPDLPESIRRDFEEARSIINLSPRGAAAMLRLCVQKLCGALGETGERLDDDIASLVAKGLDPLVQQSLDVVRVIGNEAVHPGVIDLRDDRRAAIALLDITNAIAAWMISHPKSIKEMYEKLPAGALKAIDARNRKATRNDQ